jgi:hypothetical protein
MRRQMTYAGQIPLETDLLSTNKNTMVALGYFAQAILGTTTCVDGLACSPTAPASLSVTVAPGSIYALSAVDNSSYSSLAADTTHSIMKQGILYDTWSATMTPPGTSGYAINYLIQGTFAETDDGSTVLPYYNSSNPAVAWSGPSNSGTAQYTQRSGYLTLSTKAGTAATAGSQTTPAADSGYVPLWVVTVAYGATTITSPNIAVHPSAPFINPKLYGLSSAIHYGTDTGSVNALAATVTPAVSSYVDGHIFEITPANTSTSTAPTLNVAGLGAKTIYRPDGGALTVGAIVAGAKFLAAYDGTLGGFVVLGVTKAYVDAAVAAVAPLAVLADPGNVLVTVSSNTAISVSSPSAVVTTTSAAMKLSSVSVSIATGSSGAGGLDTGTLSTSTWYYVWLIAKADGTTSGLLSASATAPTMPSGYTYKCYVGAVRADSSGYLWRTIQYRRRTKVIAGTNPTTVPAIATGPVGSLSGSVVTWSTPSVSSFAPPTALSILLSADNGAYASGGCCQMFIAPSTAYTAPWGSLPPYWAGDLQYDANGAIVEVPLVGGSAVCWYAGSNAGRLGLDGWME